MKISIITISYNSASTIEDTIRSVIAQDYSDIEYIIVDGGSTDNTQNIISKHRDHISKYISEPDNGLYDALNKGIGLASGEVIGFLHADDFFADNKVISDVAHMFADTTDAVYGDLDYVDGNATQVVRHWVAGEYKAGSFSRGWMPPHPTFYVRKEIYQRFGKFNLLLRSAADYEIMLRFIHKHHINLAYLRRVMVKMRVGGLSNHSVSARKRAFIEDLSAWVLNGYGRNYKAVALKKLRKLKQWRR